MEATRSFLFGRKDEVDLFGFDQPDNHFSLSTSAVEEECIIPPHPSQRTALPSLDSFTPEKPLIITQDPRAHNQVVGTDHRGHVPLNVPVAIETDTFVGHLRNIIKGYPGTPAAEFQDTKALGIAIIQGMFKVPTPAKDIWVGQENLTKPLLPASFQRLVFTSAAKMFSNTYRVMVEGEGDTVGYLNPLLAVATTINVSKPGEQPDMSRATEDMRLMDSSLVDRTGAPLSSTQRQRHFDRLANLETVTFDTSHVYTFVICQSIVDMPSYKLKLGALFNMDLCSVLNGQPLQMLCKNVQNNEVIMSLLVWHKQLNYPTGRKALRAGGSTCNSSGGYRHRHSRASSQDMSSTDSNSLSGVSSLYSSSSVSSMCGVDSSAGSSSGESVTFAEDDSGSSDADRQECGSVDSSSDTDYHSCIDEDDTWDYTEQQQQVTQQQAPQQQQQQQHKLALYAPGLAKQPPLLEPALSAPPGLLYCSTDPTDSPAASPVSVTVIRTSTCGLEAASLVRGRRHANSSSSGVKPRKSKGGKAAASALAAAARRLAARFKSCPGNSL